MSDVDGSEGCVCTWNKRMRDRINCNSEDVIYIQTSGTYILNTVYKYRYILQMNRIINMNIIS